MTAFAPGMSYPNLVVLMRVSSVSAASYQLVFIIRLIGNKRQPNQALQRTPMIVTGGARLRGWASLNLGVRQNRTIMKSELLTIEDSFFITNRGTVLLPDFPVPYGEWSHREEVITVLPPDSPSYDITASFVLTHFTIRDPNVSADRRLRIVLMIRDTPKEKLPKGSRILVSAEIHELLTKRRGV